jgi:hypothetical protein
MTAAVLPGGHPHADRRNWQPASTFAEYLTNCQEGLEAYSDKRAAKLLGWPRIELYRAKLMAELPQPLFERLLAVGVLSTKTMANVALALKRDAPFRGDVELCPHCGGLLRVRRHLNGTVRRAIADWLAGAPR